MINVRKIIGLKRWTEEEDKWAKESIKLVIEEVSETALKIERDAKMIVPVDTGELRGSIGTKTTKKATSISAEVGTDVEYSEIIEFGGRGRRAQPYLLPSFDKNIRSLEKKLTGILEG